MKNTFVYALAGVLSLVCLAVEAQTMKIGHTRIDYILSLTPENKVITDLLTNQQKQTQTEINRLQQELQDKYALYQKGVAQMTDIIRKDRETELQGLQSRIQEFSRTSDEAIQNKYKQLIWPTVAKIQQAIDTVAKQNGYTHILSTGNTGAILYAPEETNITELVLKYLDITPGQNVGQPAKAPSPSTPAKRVAPKPAKKK
ncbi:OmpH family outer membrane protein [Spirosoma pollinicola]|nr:OmpH family outer membrane protein [Spirosoma pollinicola]